MTKYLSVSLGRYVNLWDQLKTIDGVLCGHNYTKSVFDPVTVPVPPLSMQKQTLICNQDIPTSRLQGSEKKHVTAAMPGSLLGEYSKGCGEVLPSMCKMPEI